MEPLEGVSQFLKEYPRTLPVWRKLGQESLPVLLSEAELASAHSVSQAASADELWPIGRTWQDAIGVLIRWWADPDRPAFPDPKRPPSGTAKAVHSAIDLALNWSSLESVVMGTRTGLYELRLEDDATSFYFAGDARHEALAHMLHQPVIPSLARAVPEMDEIKAWLDRQGIDSPLSMSQGVFRAMLRLARHLSDQLTRQFDPVVSLQGFTLAEAHSIWNVIFGYAYVSRFMTMITLDPRTALLQPKVDDLTMDLVQRTSLPLATVQSFIDFLTFRLGRHPDPAVSPFVLLNNRLLIPPTLVGMSNFERNLLRLLAYDPGLYGPIGAQRGQMGTDRVAKYFLSIPGTKVAVMVDVHDRMGSSVGDLDVVAVDLVKRRGVVLEVKWPAEPDSLEEGAKAELEIRKGQEQADRLQHAIGTQTAQARFPGDWGSLDGVSWDWFVLCGTHHTSHRSLLSHRIPPISWGQLWRAPSDDIVSVVSALRDENRLPREGEDYRLIWEAVDLGEFTVRFEKIEVLR